MAAHASRVPAGHPEGYLEAFAQLYTDMAEQISARLENRSPASSSLLVPTVEDGVAGMRFISAVIAIFETQFGLDCARRGEADSQRLLVRPAWAVIIA